MKIDKFTETLLPNLAKADILEDCQVIRTMLKETLIPSYKSALEYFKTHSFQHPLNITLDKNFRQITKSGNKNLVITIEAALPTVEDNLEEVMKVIQETFGNNVSGPGMSYLQANTVQFLEYLGFFVRYARRLLSYVTIYETSTHEDGGISSIKDSIPPAEESWIQDNFTSFIRIFDMVTTEKNKLSKLFKDIPDITVTSNNYDMLKSTLGENKLDPLSMKFITGFINPFYFFGRLLTQWQVYSYNTAKKDKELFELRIMNLEAISKGQPNAKVQKEIEYLEGQVHRLEASLAKMEKDYA